MQAFLDKVRAMLPHWTLVDEVKVWWRLWSIRLGLLGTALTSFLVTFPDTASNLWDTMPDPVRSLIPTQYVPLIGVFIFVMSMISRFVKQHKATAVLADKKSDEIAAHVEELKNGAGTGTVS